jgi:hypothetical protein
MEKYHKTTGTNRALREDLEGVRQRFFASKLWK